MLTYLLLATKRFFKGDFPFTTTLVRPPPTYAQLLLASQTHSDWCHLPSSKLLMPYTETQIQPGVHHNFPQVYDRACEWFDVKHSPPPDKSYYTVNMDGLIKGMAKNNRPALTEPRSAFDLKLVRSQFTRPIFTPPSALEVLHQIHTCTLSNLYQYDIIQKQNAFLSCGDPDQEERFIRMTSRFSNCSHVVVTAIFGGRDRLHPVIAPHDSTTCFIAFLDEETLDLFGYGRPSELDGTWGETAAGAYMYIYADVHLHACTYTSISAFI